jgi:uncharacterized membrane protein YozB (DUF420 family)
MDPKVAYWTGALVNMVAIVALALRGIAHARGGDVTRHRRFMRAAALLVAAFLVSYVLKLGLLGREALELWSPRAIWVLRFHETCVLVMVAAGGFALLRAWRLRATRLVTRNPDDPAAGPALVLAHRRAGRVAAIAAVLGALSAALVLAGMYARSGAIDAPDLALRAAPMGVPSVAWEDPDGGRR